MADLSLNAVLTECALTQLELGRPTVDDIVACAFRDHREVIAQESKRLIWQAARSMAKKLLADLTDDEDRPQLRLPGLGLPSAIAVETPGGFVYVRTDKATWSDLLAGRSTREANVTRALAKLDKYDVSLVRLRPFMEGDPECTVADALGRERGVA